ncbi:MAG: hypothetical protein WD139_04950 [Balneolaceae bacterium]
MERYICNRSELSTTTEAVQIGVVLKISTNTPVMPDPDPASPAPSMLGDSEIPNGMPLAKFRMTPFLDSRYVISSSPELAYIPEEPANQ